MPTSIILVEHPTTGQSINVAPLLKALSDFDAPTDSAPGTGISNALRRVMRVLNLSEHNPALVPPGQVVDVYHDLHALEDVFDKMTVQQRVA